MNVIFITIGYPRTSEESNLYSDLMDEFAAHRHNVYVACSSEKRYGINTNLLETNGIKVLRIQTGNITSNPNYIAKGIALLQLQSQFIHALDKYLLDIKFDLIIYSTPPIQYNRIIKYLKGKSKATTYLLLKDIFPQNAVDIGLFSKWNPIYWHFRKQEKETYSLSDFIGCMSPANVKYLLQHNQNLLPAYVEVCANGIKDKGEVEKKTRDEIRMKIRREYSIEDKELLMIYGGNLGISQGLSFLLEILKIYHDSVAVKFLIVGEGTWFSRISKFIETSMLNNVILLKRVSPDDFREMLIASDVGLIFLNPKFTIPNYPSRLSSYLEVGLPVISCTDIVSDIGKTVENAGCGFKVKSGDIESFRKIIESITNDPGILMVYSENARELFNREFTSLLSYQKIISHF